MRGHLFLRRVEPGEERRGALVEQLALARRQVVVDGRLHQRVHEAEGRLRAEDLGPHELPRRGGDRQGLELGELGDGGEVRSVAEDGDRPRNLAGVPREPHEPKQHGSRGRPRPQLGDDVDVGRVGRHPIEDECLEQLVEQERVAVGGGMAGLGEGGLDTLAQPVAQDLGHRRRRERPGHEHLRVRLAQELLQDRLVGVGLRRAHAAHEHDRKLVQPPRQVGEEAERGAVAPVELVHDQQQRPFGGQVDGQPVEPVQHAEQALAERLAAVPVLVPEDGRRRARGAREQP